MMRKFELTIIVEVDEPRELLARYLAHKVNKSSSTGHADMLEKVMDEDGNLDAAFLTEQLLVHDVEYRFGGHARVTYTHAEESVS